jgi:predicted PurR-regulated permease PerM
VPLDFPLFPGADDMTSTGSSIEDRAFTSRVLEASIRLGLIALLVFWCFNIARPFIQPIVWGIIIAIASHGLHRRIAGWLGGRSGLAAALLVVAALLMLLGPAIALTASLVETASHLSGELRAGSLKVPAPAASVQGWPIVGERLYGYWVEGSQNLEATLSQFTPQLKQIGLWLISTAGTTGVGILVFAISIVIAGVILANGPAAAATASRVAGRLAGDRGGQLTELAAATVMSVTRGILGVAVIQAFLAGIGLLVAGVPAAGLWTLLVLLLAVVQLPSLLVLGPIIVYVFSTSSTAVAVLFAIWSVAVGLSDNVLKPLLMGRGVDVPMLVVFMGAIGGFMNSGIIGLFVGAVVLAVGYTLFTTWLTHQDSSDEAV